jgi:Rab guanine nucleotide exchange factor SEC2
MTPASDLAHSPAHEEPPTQPAKSPAADGVTENKGDETPAALLSPPEEAEAFTTPVEELSAPPSLERPVSPTSIPLPPTGPSTPVHETAPVLPAHGDTTDTTVPEVPPPIRTSEDKPALPPRATAPGAPPLPRRAAARARPISVASSPVTPRGGEASSAEPTRPGTDDESKSEAATSDPPNEPRPAGDEKPSNAHENEIKPEDETHGQEYESDPTIQEPPKEEQPKEGETTKPTVEAGSELPTGDATSAGHLPAISENGREIEESAQPVDSPKEGSLKSLEDVPLANDLDNVVDEPTRDHATSDITSDVERSETVAEDDSGMYVGNSTWEERTWKELVNLREEMFWARVGGLR